MADEATEPPPEEPPAESEQPAEEPAADAPAEDGAPADDGAPTDDGALAEQAEGPGEEAPLTLEVASQEGLIPGSLADLTHRDSQSLDTSPSLTQYAPQQSMDAIRKAATSVSSIPEKMGSMAQLDRRRSRMDRYSSKARMTLGSVIDIRRGTMMGDAVDRKVPRYMNSYKMESDNPFNPEKVDRILQLVMVEAMENLTYDVDKCPKQAKWASMAIRAKIKDLDFDRYKIIILVTIGEKHSQDVYATCRFLWDAEKDRYKIVCLVTIGEKNSQDVLATCRFLWDVERDRYCIFSMENTHVFGIAMCFGIYYE